jgi:hypothetical protein
MQARKKGSKFMNYRQTSAHFFYSSSQIDAKRQPCAHPSRNVVARIRKRRRRKYKIKLGIHNEFLSKVFFPDTWPSKCKRKE